MKNQIIQLGEKNRKVFGFSDDQIIFSSKGHSSFDTLLSATEKSGLLESVSTIPIRSLSEIIFNERDETFTIKYDKSGKTKKDIVLLKDVSSRDSVVEEIASLKGLSKNIVDESKTQPLLLNLIVVLAIPVFTWVFRGMAIDAQNGEHYVATGRRRGSAQLFANAVEAIGPMGITIIGIVGLIYMIYRTFKRYQNPASEVKFG